MSALHAHSRAANAKAPYPPAVAAGRAPVAIALLFAMGSSFVGDVDCSGVEGVGAVDGCDADAVEGAGE